NALVCGGGTQRHDEDDPGRYWTARRSVSRPARRTPAISRGGAIRACARAIGACACAIRAWVCAILACVYAIRACPCAILARLCGIRACLWESTMQAFRQAVFIRPGTRN